MTVGKRKRSKFGNRKATFQGLTFDSILERDRWIVLCSRADRGIISNLTRQITYNLTAHGKPICSYRADFDYIKDGQAVTEDAKGMILPEFRIKAKLFEAQTGRKIQIITKQTLHRE